MAPIRILLVDDHVLFRRGVASLLARCDDMEVVGEAGNGREGVELAVALQPDVVLMDIQMPICDGIQATKLIRERMQGTRILVLTVSEEDTHLFDAIRAGAHGYLLKNIQPETLYQSIFGVLRGEAPLSGVVAADLLREFSRAWPGPSAAPSGSHLSQRELEILSLVAGGASNRQIAVQLVITEGTVKNHLHNILEKLHLRNRAEAAAFAVRQGLIDPEVPSSCTPSESC